MRSFDFYEFAGILAPGTIMLVGLFILYPELSTTIHGQNLSLGAFGLITILAYVLGHITQAIGNVLESIWWKLWSGMPTDWVRSAKHDVLAASQLESLRPRLESRLAIKLPEDLTQLSAAAWYSVTRQVYAAVAAQTRSARIDVFNGNYGLNRGIAAALITIAVQSFILGTGSHQVILLMLVGAAIALYRMHRFAVHYARELFIQFLQLPALA